jgi:transcriptional regulator with XRE-family HTH domain
MARRQAEQPEDKADRSQTLKAFAERVRELRQLAGVSQAHVEARAFFPHSEVSRFERGAGPGLLSLLRLAYALGVSPGVLLDELPVPRRKVNTERTIALVLSQPDISTASIALALNAPRCYVGQILFHLRVTGAVEATATGWRATQEPTDWP